MFFRNTSTPFNGDAKFIEYIAILARPSPENQLELFKKNIPALPVSSATILKFQPDPTQK